MSAFVFIESNTTGTGQLFCERVTDRGYETYFLTATPEKYGYLKDLYVSMVKVDTSDFNEVMSVVSTIQKVEAVFSTSEYFIGMASRVSAKLRLHTANCQAIEICRDKHKLSKTLTSKNVATADARLISLHSDLQVARSYFYPCIVKPQRGSGSVAVKKVGDAGELNRHLRSMEAQGYESVLLQPYLLGKEYSVETMTINGRSEVLAIVEKGLGEEPEFVEISHKFPCNITDEDRHLITQTVGDAMKAIDYRFGPAHVELRLHGSLASIIEINPRLAGGMIPVLIEKVCDFPLIDTIIDCWVGKNVDLQLFPKCYGVIQFTSASESGLLVKEPSLNDAEEIKSLCYFEPLKQKDEFIELHGDFTDRIAVGILTNEDRESLDKDLATYNRSLAYTIEQDTQLADHQNTSSGILSGKLNPEIHDVIYSGRSENDSAYNSLIAVNEAHLVMLSESGLVEKDDVVAILQLQQELKRTNYKALKSRPCARGLYISFENYVAEQLGDKVAGVIQSGRSRNDMNATFVTLAVLDNMAKVLDKVFRLSRTLSVRASHFQYVPFVIYSQYQPAQPGLVSHVLDAYGKALSREFESLLHQYQNLQESPLGAGAGGGTSLSIDSELTSRLLGFDRPAANSLDAVAGRDHVQRFLNSLTILCGLMSRIAQDFQLWTCTESGLVRFPDELCGTSSMLPQKRNPYPLEYIKNQACEAFAQMSAVTMSIMKTPYNNSYEVGNQLEDRIQVAADATLGVLTIVDQIISLFDVDHSRVESVIKSQGLMATLAAEQLVKDKNLNFRQAHSLLGRRIKRAMDENKPLDSAFSSLWNRRSLLDEILEMGSGGAADTSKPKARMKSVIELARRGKKLHRIREGRKSARMLRETLVSKYVS